MGLRRTGSPLSSPFLATHLAAALKRERVNPLDVKRVLDHPTAVRLDVRSLLVDVAVVGERPATRQAPPATPPKTVVVKARCVFLESVHAFGHHHQQPVWHGVVDKHTRVPCGDCPRAV